MNDSKRCQIITIANQKGGVGKTTTAYNLGYVLSENGNRVLLIDIDPQANLTRCAGVESPDDLSYPINRLFDGLLKDEPVLPTEEYIFVQWQA